MSKIGWFGVVRSNSRSLEIAPFNSQISCAKAEERLSVDAFTPLHRVTLVNRTKSYHHYALDLFSKVVQQGWGVRPLNKNTQFWNINSSPHKG